MCAYTRRTPSVNQETLTPRASTTSSSTRKKRRRKSSQSESKKNTGSNVSNLPQSPTGTPSSPVVTTPIPNPLSANLSLDSRQTPKENVSRHSTPPVDYDSTPVECQSGNTVADESTQGSGGVSGWTEKMTRSGKKSKKSSKARTKLITRFNTTPSESSNVLEDSKGLNNGVVSHLNSKNIEHDVIRDGVSLTNSLDRAPPKRPWAQASPRCIIHTQ